ncbi:hypothetical protein PAERUG_E16_London_17_VIM_2_04_14_03803 [Pseudomonas aeruginosa]|nr:hypothetical protein PAERUG_E16_London_17_VIM_2_04_14_03803 [Pseudomonas aeruginosa]
MCIRDSGAHRPDDLQQQARAILQGAAPGVAAAVAQRREELAEQVTVGGMDLHPAEAGPLGQAGAAGEPLDHLGDHRLVHRLRRSEVPGHPAQFQRHRRGCPGLLAEIGLHLPAGMVDLQPELRAGGTPDARPAAEFLQLRVVFQDHPAGAGHGTAVDHHVTADQQPGAAVGPGLVEAHQAFGGGLRGIGHVLLHGGLGEAIGNGRAVGKRQRVEQVHGPTS